MHVEESIRIDRPVQQVFDYVSEVELPRVDGNRYRGT